MLSNEPEVKTSGSMVKEDGVIVWTSFADSIMYIAVHLDMQKPSLLLTLSEEADPPFEAEDFFGLPPVESSPFLPLPNPLPVAFNGQ